MLTPADRFSQLSPAQKRLVHFDLCAHAIEAWTAFCRSKRRINYADSVTGTKHAVDKRLPADAYRCAHQGQDVANVDERYGEPITALQDDDFVLPDNIKFAYFAVHNLFNKYCLHEHIDDWTIVNQALAAEDDERRWLPMLDAAIENTT